MTKVSVLSAAVLATGFGLFALNSESKAQTNVFKNHYIHDTKGDIIWFLPREREFFSSRMYYRNDTLIVTAGKYLIKERNGNVYLNDRFFGSAFEGDTVILHKATFLKKAKLEFRRVEYEETRLPNGFVFVVPKRFSPHLQFQVHKTENENKHKIFLNGVDRGEVFANDTVILRPRGTLIFKSTNRIEN